MIKRLLDIVLSLVGLILLLPVFALVALVLRFTGEGEIWFRQPRIGKGGKIFQIWKFATMLKASPDMPGGVLTHAGDPRILPVGGFLRQTKINEFPQLFNVLVGDMSLVGPRPQADDNFRIYSEEVRSEIVRARPGVTGIAQVLLRNEGRMLPNSVEEADRLYRHVIMPYKGLLEVWYVRHANMWLDLVLIALTGVLVVFPNFPIPKAMVGALPEPPRELAI